MTRLTQAAKSALVALAAFTLFASAAHAQWERTVTLKNDSNIQIDRFYVSPVGSDIWGPDRLGRGVLSPNYYTTLQVYPGRYDVKLVTHAGNVCKLANMDFSSSDMIDVNNFALLACAVLTN